MIKKIILYTCLATIFIVFNHTLSAKETTRLLRFPDIHHDKVVFVYAGDIYIADINTGKANRLTSHPGQEAFPKFSRNGEKIAFSAEFSGSRQVFIMNNDGSDLKQLTWYNDVGPMPPRGGFDYRILDFSPDDQKILVRANRLPWGIRMGKPYWVPVDGSLAQPSVIPETGGGMLSPDGSHYVYTPIDREFRTWKRYRGGRAQEIWTYDLKNNTSKQLTNHPGTDNQPVWVDGEIYFTSDRNYTLNLFKYSENSQPEQITHHKEYDVLWASAGPESIVYENDGYIWRYHPQTKKNYKLDIEIIGNRQYQLPQRKSVVDFIQSIDLSPNGKRVAIAARGDIFTVPASKGEIRQVFQSPSSREIDITWSPNGKHLAYLSDKSGEYELYTVSAKPAAQPEQLTSDGHIWRFPPKWSPDSRYLAYADKNQTLWVYDTHKKTNKKLDRSNRNDITHYRWSPDSHWITYTKAEDNGFSSIWVYNITSNQQLQLTNKDTNDFSPVFDTAGQYLFFLSNRDYNLSFSSYEFNYLYHNATRIYAARLNNNAKHIYPFISDESTTTENQPKSKENKKVNAIKNIDIEPSVFRTSIVSLPGNAGNYFDLQTKNNKLFVLSNRESHSDLLRLHLGDEIKSELVINDINAYYLSDNGEKILISKNNNYAIIDSNEKAVESLDGKKLDLKNLTVKIDPQLEWQQMYTDAWRILRDWFYDPNLHGMDWNSIRQKYQPWVNAIAHRADLDYILGEIAGELNAGHVYVNNGDQPQVIRQENGLLGAELVRDKSGYFRIEKIFPGENWHDNYRSPLTQSSINIQPGDYIISVNGASTQSTNNIYQLLEHQANRTVELKINNKPSKTGARSAFIKPITSEHNLRYLEWVKQRMDMVNKLSNGRIGYIHLPNTAEQGNRELFKYFLPQINKDALIIDDRYNGGGFIPDRMIELLSRKTLNYWKFRGLDPNATPLIAHDGPKAMLINGLSSSGGDALPYYFRKNNLGPIIGTRTWGGLIGISGNPGLVDGGSVLAATFRFIDTDGKWAVENVGVSPDIEVIDYPHLVAQGQDPSLKRAVDELLKSLDKNPRKAIKAPPAPTKF